MKAILTIFLVVFLMGCKDSGFNFIKTPEEKLVQMCIDELNKNLKSFAKYDGWNTKKAKGSILSIEPNTERNIKYNVDLFHKFHVVIDNFTVKNGFNADVNSTSSCYGNITMNSDGELNLPSSPNLFKMTLNGRGLDLGSMLDDIIPAN